MPGVMMGLLGLSSGTAQLPQVGLDAPTRVIGKNTADCMKSGAVYGNAAMIDGMIDRFVEEYGAELPVYATGGYSHAIIKHCKHEIVVDENLVLHGLYIIYKKNN
jgi:type III pantothenate kinase